MKKTRKKSCSVRGIVSRSRCVPPVNHLYWKPVIEIRHQQRYFQEPISTSVDTEDMDTSGRVLRAKRRTSSASRQRVLDGVASAASSSSWPQPQSPPVDGPSTLPTTIQLIPKPTPASSRRRQHPRYQPLVSTSEPEPNRTATSPLLSERAFPQLPTIVSKKPLKNASGDTLPAKSAWSRGPPPVWSWWSPTEPDFQFDPEPEPDSEPEPEPEPEPELEPYTELEFATIDRREWKGKQRQTSLLHGGDCSCYSCFPSLSPY